MNPIPLFGTGLQSLTSAINAQRRLNCFYEVRDDGDKSSIVIRGTPGLSIFTTVPNASIRGFWAYNNRLYVVSGQFLYSVTTLGNTTLLGTLSTTQGYVSISNNSTQLMIVDGVKGYILTFASSAFAVISDANFPTAPQFVAFLQNRFVVSLFGTQNFYVSSSSDGTNWTTPITIIYSKQDQPDLLIALDVLHDTLVLWGDTSTEFWQNVGTYPGPYQRIPGATQDWGLAAPYSRALFKNSIAFLAKNRQGQVQVMLLNGFVPDRISTSDVENIINTINKTSIISDAVALSYIIDGHIMYQLTFPTGGRSLLYDGLTNMWSEVQTGVALFARHIANLGVVFNNNNYVSDTSTGNIYLLDPTTYTDNGVYIKRQVRTRHIGGKGDYLGLASVRFAMDVGVGLQSGQGSNPQIMLQVSRDGGKTFESERWTTIGAVGQYTTQVQYNRLGQEKGNGFVFQITMTDPVPFILSEAYADPDQTVSR
jgi:hypothetical protein